MSVILFPLSSVFDIELLQAFETLVSVRIFISVSAVSSSVAKEFVKYRRVVEREEVKAAVMKMGQTNLKKWLNKAP